MVAKCIRRLTLRIKIIWKAIGLCVVKGPDGREEDQSEPKSVRDKALDEYRKTLEKMFSDQTGINYIMVYVRRWADGR